MKRKIKAILRQKAEQKRVAAERIVELFRQAEARFKESPMLANRYVEIARKLSMKYKARIPAQLKRRYCKYCHAYLVPSVNCRVRLQNKKVVYYCLDCKRFMRIPYLREIKEKKAKSLKENE